MASPAPGTLMAKEQSCQIIDLSAAKARAFLLKEQSYSTVDLPAYIRFDTLISGIRKILKGKQLAELCDQKPSDFEGVNHLILDNKDGRHAWRPLQLIHPALYVSLVNRMTEKDNWELIRNRFEEFSRNQHIRCLSLPRESLSDEEDQEAQINYWWHHVEQASITLALDYQFIIHTDIVDCYGAIYTHSIAWALHTKAEAKKKENKNDPKLIGVAIDKHIQDMRHGQTNGIPQGSVLMDFVAEMVLGYSDIELTQEIADQKVDDYRILRYRDDYRIFVNSSQDGERILKSLTEVMIGLGLRLNPAKTRISNHVVRTSIKEDKLSWISRRQSDKSIQKHLLIIHNHSTDHPNAGSLAVALKDFYRRVRGINTCAEPWPLISIVVDIAYRNPRTYAICAAILSKLISFLKTEEDKRAVVAKARRKFSQLPNTGHMQIWLQRVSYPFAPEIDFDEPLCRLVCGQDESIWNSEWVSSKTLKQAIDSKKIVNAKKLKTLDSIVPQEEVVLFAAKAEIAS